MISLRGMLFLITLALKASIFTLFDAAAFD
jgi:hypothetical protein